MVSNASQLIGFQGRIFKVFLAPCSFSRFLSYIYPVTKSENMTKAVKITVTVTNAITRQVDIDNSNNPFTVDNYDFDVMRKNAEIFKHAYPDSCVTFYVDNGDFIACMPLNQELDQERLDRQEISWQDYHFKWYPSFA